MRCFDAAVLRLLICITGNYWLNPNKMSLQLKYKGLVACWVVEVLRKDQFSIIYRVKKAWIIHILVFSTAEFIKLLKT